MCCNDLKLIMFFSFALNGNGLCCLHFGETFFLHIQGLKRFNFVQKFNVVCMQE